MNTLDIVLIAVIVWGLAIVVILRFMAHAAEASARLGEDDDDSVLIGDWPATITSKDVDQIDIRAYLAKHGGIDDHA